jgi:amino acid adenylation domain-containing protein
MADQRVMRAEQGTAPATPGPGAEPLASGQEQLWFLDALAPGIPTYNICSAYRLSGPVSVGVLGRALAYLVDRHDALRATFGEDAGVPYQTLTSGATGDVTVIDVADLDSHERSHAVERMLLAEADTPFDLESGPLYRFRLIRTGPHDHVLCLSFHHIITDGWSTGIFYDELAHVYRALRDGVEPALDPLPCQYVDYVRWQRERRQGPIAERLSYWEHRLAGLPVLDLPADRPRPAAPTYSGDLAMLEFPPALLAAARTAAGAHRVSLLMLLAATITAVLGRYTGKDDIPLGVSMLGRTEPEHERLVGLFVNMVVLRSDLSADPSVADLLERTADALLDAYDYQDVPFDLVVERVQPVRDAGRNPLFQVAVQLLGDANSGGNLKLPGIAAEPLPIPPTRSRFDLVLNFVESADSLRLETEYSTELFDRTRIDAWHGHVERALGAICADPSMRISELPLLSADERERVLAAGLGEVSGRPPEPVHAAVARIAAADPDAVAVTYRSEQLSYGELDRRAEALAQYLRAQGIRHEQIVAIAMNREPSALVAFLGVMKAGAAYTFLDTALPASRLEFMLHDTAAPLVLTTSDLVERLPQADGWRVKQLDREWDAIEATPGGAVGGPAATGDSLVYVLYTSGSSGKPKGVLVEHRALLSAVRAYGAAFGLHAGDRMLQLSALSFDMAHGEIFAGLIVGATLVMVPDGAGTPDALTGLIRDERLTFISMAPAMLALVDAGPYPCLERVMAGGDVLPAEIVSKWVRPGRWLVNLYGPTEATVACTGFRCDPGGAWPGSPPIGRPWPDRRMYVVDRWGNLTPQGVAGELLIGGSEGVARGYLNRPDLTAERFVEDPFHPGGRVYRTGDLVRWTDDWQLEFLGRLDAQVQLNGLRVELEEIEAALLAHPDVGMAAVAVRRNGRGEARLVGYVAPAADRPPDITELRGHLSEQLPGYMVPTAWLVLDELPLTTALKVDRKALPEPGAPAADSSASEEDFVPPGTETEATVAETFAAVLGRPRVGATGNFFELGGNSLGAMRAISRLNKVFGIRINVRAFYGAGTVGNVAKLIDARGGPAVTS